MHEAASRAHAEEAQQMAHAEEAQQMDSDNAERVAARLHEKWLQEEVRQDYVPPDASWPPQVSRPRRSEIPGLRCDVLATCKAGEAAGSRCQAVKLRLAFALLGGVLFGHAGPDQEGADDGVDNPETTEAALVDDASEGVQILHALADHLPEAACGYAMCLMDGHGLGEAADDEAAAISYYTRAAEAGYVHAQHALAVALYLGEGTAVDEKRAVHWFERAAAQGHPNAQFMLGEMLLEGSGVPQADPMAAMRLFFAAGELGHVGARARVRCTLLGMPHRRPFRRPERLLGPPREQA
jgi:hypothetical protein